MACVDEQFSIGTLSDLTGVTTETIRYYERKGLIPHPPRTPSGHRSYSSEHLKRLTFVRRSRQLGFSLQEIRGLLDTVYGGSYTCDEIRARTITHVRDVQQRIAELRRMEAALMEISAQCAGGPTQQCPIIDALFDLRAASSG